jgi:uncharacterized protein YjbI with pentapeptide repeats
MRTITAEELKKIVEDHLLWIRDEGGAKADLSYANLRSADLCYANLSSADLCYANLSSADLNSADLSSADLRRADLRRADLRSADLCYANLSSADLRSANLIGADLDFSCIPLRCGGLRWKIDRRIAAQIAYHFCSMECDDPDFIRARDSILDFANTFHRVEECGRLTPVEIRDEEKGAAV